MAEPNSSIARKAILEVIKNQIRDGSPPETKQKYDRLIADGHQHEETMKLIGCVVSSEIFDMLKRGKTFDEERYVAALHAL